MQYVAVLLGFLAAGIFHHSWLLRRFPSLLVWMLARQFWPCSLPSCPPTPIIILWVVRLGWGNEDCLIIASASSWISSKLEPVCLSGHSCHLCGCIWLPASTSSHPLYSPISFLNLPLFLYQIPISLSLFASGIELKKSLLHFHVTHSHWELPSRVKIFYRCSLGAVQYKPVGVALPWTFWLCKSTATIEASVRVTSLWFLCLSRRSDAAIFYLSSVFSVFHPFLFLLLHLSILFFCLVLSHFLSLGLVVPHGLLFPSLSVSPYNLLIPSPPFLSPKPSCLIGFVFLLACLAFSVWPLLPPSVSLPLFASQTSPF